MGRLRAASGEVAVRLGKVWEVIARLPLTEKVSFQAMLQRGNRLQVPKVVRWSFKLESDQVLKVTVSCPDVWLIGEQFYATMSKDGRIVVPKLILTRIKRDKHSLEGYAFKVIFEPS